MSVYVIEDGKGHVKVGKARDPYKRISQHQSSNPNDLIIIAILKGYTQLESKILKDLSEFKVQGRSQEWFYYNDRSKKIIDGYISRSASLKKRKGLKFFGETKANLKEHEVSVDDALDFLNALHEKKILNIFVENGYGDNIGGIFAEVEPNYEWIYFANLDTFRIRGDRFYIDDNGSFCYKRGEAGGGFGRGYLTDTKNYDDKRNLCLSIHPKGGLSWLLTKINEEQVS